MLLENMGTISKLRKFNKEKLLFQIISDKVFRNEGNHFET